MNNLFYESKDLVYNQIVDKNVNSREKSTKIEEEKPMNNIPKLNIATNNE